MHINPASFDTKAVAAYATSAQNLTIVDFLMKMVPTNLVGDLAKGEMMPVLIMAVLFGFALCRMGERGARLVALLDDFTHAIFARGAHGDGAGAGRRLRRDGLHHRQVRLRHARQSTASCWAASISR